MHQMVVERAPYLVPSSPRSTLVQDCLVTPLFVRSFIYSFIPLQVLKLQAVDCSNEGLCGPLPSCFVEEGNTVEIRGMRQQIMP